MSVKNGLAISITTIPIERLRPARSWRADSLRTQPSFSIASSTRRRVRSDTTPGELITLDTVPTETPASAATSLTLIVDFGTAMNVSTPLPVGRLWQELPSPRHRTRIDSCQTNTCSDPQRFQWAGPGRRNTESTLKGLGLSVLSGYCWRHSAIPRPSSAIRAHRTLLSFHTC